MNDAPEPTPPAAGAGLGIPGVPELAARTAAATGDFEGAWLLTEGEGLLKIEGTEWRRPDKGLGALSSGRET